MYSEFYMNLSNFWVFFDQIYLILVYILPNFDKFISHLSKYNIFSH